MATVAVCVFTLASCSRSDAPGPATYVGASACVECHAAETERWRGSHHDLAMERADAATVLGDFDSARFDHHGEVTEFARRDGRFWVRTEGPDGRVRDFEVKYTFGVEPLQQYLLEMSGGRLQAFGVAYDTRPREAGGQRWFHLYPDERLSPGDPLHWTGIDQTWNFMCAECHSTNLRRNYDAASDTYDTRWSEIDVACEACHGPGSLHVAWARAYQRDPAQRGSGSRGLVADLDAGDGSWQIAAGDSVARWSGPPRGRNEIETCAPCHSRRAPITRDRVPGQPLLQAYHPRLIEEPLYYVDGQVRDEVYVYGSFLQSRMYEAGVTCSDCHDPHGLRLRADGNALCVRCHAPAKYDTKAHHFHPAGSLGALCVECHMPARTYMIVDDRRDHSLRVPRPDLTVELGTPNACNGCHNTQTPQWAADAIAAHFGERRRELHLGQALYAAREGDPRAAELLRAIVADTARTAMVRASALAAIARVGFLGDDANVRQALSDSDALVRSAAVSALDALPPERRLQLAAPLLADSVLAVRLAAARAVGSVPREIVPGPMRSRTEAAAQAFIASLLVNAERPTSHYNLGNFHASRRDFAAAEAAYREAIARDSTFVPAYVNLADMYRAQGRDVSGEATLRAAIRVNRETPDVLHALGLLFVREKQLEDAVETLGRAAALAPDDLRLNYVYGVALADVGRRDEALAVLEDAYRRHPRSADILHALVITYRDAGDYERASDRAEALVELTGGALEAQRLLDDVRSLRGRR